MSVSLSVSVLEDRDYVSNDVWLTDAEIGTGHYFSIKKRQERNDHVVF